MLSTTLFAVSWVAMLSGVAVWFSRQTAQQPAPQAIARDRD